MQAAHAVTIDRDRQLLEALRRHEPTAAEQLVATYRDRVYRLAIGITGNGPDAEEAVQDAFWSVVRKIDTFRGDSSLGSWIYRVVANAAYQKVRGRARRRFDISLDEVPPRFHENGRHADLISDWSARIHDQAAQTELHELCVALDAAIEDLPPTYRLAIVLRDVEGESMAEVANVLGITIATAKSRAHRARLFLRQSLAIFTSGATASNVSPSLRHPQRRPSTLHPPKLVPGNREQKPYRIRKQRKGSPMMCYPRSARLPALRLGSDAKGVIARRLTRT